jgi:hypothetical protein
VAKVFISYSRTDSEFVAMLVNHLKSNEITVSYDQTDFAIGDSIAASINLAIKEADFVLIIMSPDYFNSSWATKEMEMSLAEEFDKGKTKVIPLLCRDTKIPPLLMTKKYADFRSPVTFESSFAELMKVFGAPKPLLTQIDKTGGESQLALGSILKKALESDEVKGMIEGIKLNVATFIQHSVEPPVNCTPVSITVDPTLCFVVMPFSSEELNDVYEYFIKPAIEGKCELKCERGDDVFGSNVIMEDIRGAIEKARLVVADLTGKNANVFYEVGIAHTLNKPVLLLSQSMNDVPFDLRHRRVLLYDYSPKGCKVLEGKIVENIKALLK